MRRGLLCEGEKVQFTDRKGKMITVQLAAGGSTQTERGFIDHDDAIGAQPGSVILTVTAAQLRERHEAKRASESDAIESSGAYGHADQSDGHPDRPIKPWKQARRQIGGWAYTVMRPRMCDYVLSMPRGPQIMYPKDIAQVLSLGDVKTGARVLESGGGSGAMSLSLLDAVGPEGSLVTIERRPDFARVCLANAEIYYGEAPAQWDMRVGEFDEQAAALPADWFDTVFLDMLDPWNRLEQVGRVIAPGGTFVAYVTTTTQVSRMAEALRDAGNWTEPQVSELFERQWKAQGLAVRPEHQMIGHTGFLLTSRAMATGVEALRRHERATKDTYTDVDVDGGEPLDELELRDISDRKLRKVLRDLDEQVRVARGAVHQQVQ